MSICLLLKFAKFLDINKKLIESFYHIFKDFKQLKKMLFIINSFY